MKSVFKKKIVWIPLVILVAVGLASSGFIYNNILDGKKVQKAILEQAFVAQYGNKALIRQTLEPRLVTERLWTDTTDNSSYISWSTGDFWVVVYKFP